MIKWTRLQLGALPIIAIETDTAIEQLEELVWTVNKYGRNEDIEILNSMKESFLNRIEMLQRFYQNNYLDSTISIFHMIKLKLKKAVFKIPSLSNQTLLIGLNSMDQSKAVENIPKLGFNSNNQSESKLEKSKIQLQPKTKSKSKSKAARSKQDLLKLLDTSRMQEEEDTNLMEDPRHTPHHGFDNSFHGNRNHYDDQLLKNYNQARNDKSWKKTKNNDSKKVSNLRALDKSLSPAPGPGKTKQIDLTKFQNLKKSAHKSTFELGTKTKTAGTGRPNMDGNKSIVDGKNKPANGKKEDPGSKKEKVKLKTEGQEMRVEQNQSPGQFRFTIKMTKEEYLNLLKMKQMMKKGMIS